MTEKTASLEPVVIKTDSTLYSILYQKKKLLGFTILPEISAYYRDSYTDTCSVKRHLIMRLFAALFKSMFCIGVLLFAGLGLLMAVLNVYLMAVYQYNLFEHESSGFIGGVCVVSGLIVTAWVVAISLILVVVGIAFALSCVTKKVSVPPVLGELYASAKHKWCKPVVYETNQNKKE